MRNKDYDDYFSVSGVTAFTPSGSTTLNPNRYTDHQKQFESLGSKSAFVNIKNDITGQNYLYVPDSYLTSGYTENGRQWLPTKLFEGNNLKDFISKSERLDPNTSSLSGLVTNYGVEGSGYLIPSSAVSDNIYSALRPQTYWDAEQHGNVQGLTKNKNGQFIYKTDKPNGYIDPVGEQSHWHQPKKKNNLGGLAALGLSLFAPGIGTAIGTALGASGVAASVIGGAIVNGTLAELSGGDFADGAIMGAVTAGVSPVVARTIGSSVAQAMGDSVFKNVVTGAVTNAATSAVMAGVLGEDVGKAALNGAISGVAAGVGQDVATAMEYDTDLFSPQTEMLRAQERGLGTAADAGGKFGVAGANILRGADPLTTLINTTLSTITDDANSAPTAGSSGTTSTVAEADTGADTGVENGVDVPGMAQLEDILNQSSGTQLASSNNDAALQAIEDLRKPDMGEDPLLGLSSAEVGQGEQEAIDDANLDDLLGLSSAEVGTDEQGSIDYQKAYDDLLGLSSAEVGQGEQGSIDYQKAYDDLLGLSSAEVGEDEQKAIDDALASEQTDPKGAKPGGAKPGGAKPGAVQPGGAKPGAVQPGGPGSNMLGLLSLLGGAGATGQRAPQQSEDQTSAEPLVAFDWTKPLQTTPFAAPATAPKMATGGSIDELLEMLQYRG